MKKKKRIFILIIAVLIIIGSGVYLGTIIMLIDIENDLNNIRTLIQVKDFNQGIFFRWSWNNRCPDLLSRCKSGHAAYAHSMNSFCKYENGKHKRVHIT